MREALCPSQMEMVAGEMPAEGRGFTFTVLEADAVHPFASVAVTVYEVVVVGLTVILAEVDPLLHE